MNRRTSNYTRYDTGRLPVIHPVSTWAHLANYHGPDVPPAAAPALPQALQAYLPGVAQAAAAYEAAGDPRQQVELYKAKIQNLQAMKARIPLAAVFYDGEIAKLRAKLRAAQAQVSVATEKDQATRDWRKLGYTISGVGILLGAAVIGVVLIGGARLARS